MPDIVDLTDLQLKLLGVLWHRGRASASDIHAALAGPDRPSKKTVAILLTRLESRGLVRHGTVGRTNVYEATVTRRRVLRERLGALLTALFGGPDLTLAPGALPDTIRREDLEELRLVVSQATEPARGRARR